MAAHDPDNDVDELIRQCAVRYRVTDAKLSIRDAKNLFLEGVHAIVVTKGDRLESLVTRRDLRYMDADDRLVEEIMTPRNKLVTVKYPAHNIREQAIAALNQYRLKRILLVDDNFTFRGMLDEMSLRTSTEEESVFGAEDDDFPLDTNMPLTLLLGNVDHEGVLSSLTNAPDLYERLRRPISSKATSPHCPSAPTIYQLK